MRGQVMKGHAVRRHLVRRHMVQTRLVQGQAVRGADKKLSSDRIQVSSLDYFYKYLQRCLRSCARKVNSTCMVEWSANLYERFCK